VEKPRSENRHRSRRRLVASVAPASLLLQTSSHHHSPLPLARVFGSQNLRSMQAPPLAALAGGAWAASNRPAILAAPASLRRARRGALRLPAWRAAGGGRAPRVPAKGAVLASDMGAEEVVGPSPLLDARGEQGSTLLPNAPCLSLSTFYSIPLVEESTQKSHLIRPFA
jgi:hypothetical protein